MAEPMSQADRDVRWQLRDQISGLLNCLESNDDLAEIADMVKKIVAAKLLAVKKQALVRRALKAALRRK